MGLDTINEDGPTVADALGIVVVGWDGFVGHDSEVVDSGPSATRAEHQSAPAQIWNLPHLWRTIVEGFYHCYTWNIQM